MSIWILNSAVLAAGAYGTYRYEPATWEDLTHVLHTPGWISRVGYEETANVIERHTGIRVPLSREASPMRPGDCAYIVRLRYRIDPRVKAAHVEADEAMWEVALLTRAY